MSERLLAEWKKAFSSWKVLLPLRTTAITTFRAKEMAGCLAAPSGSHGAVWYFLFLVSPMTEKI